MGETTGPLTSSWKYLCPLCCAIVIFTCVSSRHNSDHWHECRWQRHLFETHFKSQLTNFFLMYIIPRKQIIENFVANKNLIIFQITAAPPLTNILYVEVFFLFFDSPCYPGISREYLLRIFSLFVIIAILNLSL